MPKLVILETPFRGDNSHADLERNINFAKACMRDCLFNHDEAPFASHVLFLDPVTRDVVLHERETGIEAGLAWGIHAEATVVYTDHGISEGMKLGIERAKKEGRPVIFRTLKSS